MAISTAIKDYIANMYCGGTITLAGVNDFGEACALNSLRTPLPAGETHDTLCTSEVLNWCAANIGYTPSGAPPPPPDNGYSSTPGPSTDIPANMARYWFCTVPGGVNPIINDIKYDTVITPGCSEKDPKWVHVDVAIGIKNKIEFEMLPNFERYDNRCKYGTDPYWPPLVEHQETAIRFALTAAPGAATGAIHLTAQDSVTKQFLSARPNINGISGEEKYLLIGEDGMKMPLPVGNYEITVTHPGYETPERVEIRLTESYTDADPYHIPFDMKAIKIFKVIEVREKAMKAAWIVSFDIESPVIWEVQSAGSIQFEFLEEGIYRTYFDLHPMPADWGVDYPIEQLPASAYRVYCTIEGDYEKVVDGQTLPVLNPILHTNRRYRAPFEMLIHAGTLAAGYYIAVASIEKWREL